MTQTLRLRQSSTTLADFQDVNDFPLRSFACAALGQNFGVATLVFDVVGTSITDFGDNLVALGRALLLAQQNKEAFENGWYYTPVYLQFQPADSSNLLQAECFGVSKDSDGAIQNILANPQTLLSSRIENVTLNLLIRGYFEETAAVAVSGSPFTLDNATGSATIASLRGDLPAPLKIKVRGATTNQTQVIASLKARGTTSNFIHAFSLNTAAGTGYTVAHNATFTANLTDANLVGGVGCRVTPTSALNSASEIAYLTRVTITSNVSDFHGTYRVLVRMRDNHASAVKAYLRVRSGAVDSSGTVLGRGDYGANATAAGTIGGTTALPLIDCGVIKIPFTDAGGAQAAYRPIIEIWGYTTDASLATFDLNTLFLCPCYEAAQSGYASITLPAEMGNAAAPDALLDANDRTSPAYLVDGSDVWLVNADTVTGQMLMAYPNTSQILYVHTRRLNNTTHPKSNSLTVTVSYTPRYKLVRGS